MSSINTHLQNHSPNVPPSPPSLKTDRGTEYLNAAFQIENLKTEFKQSWKRPNLPLAQLMRFYQIFVDTNYDEIEIEVCDNDILTNPEHRKCLFGEVNGRSEAIEIASKIQHYLLRNEALFCAIISKPSLEDLPFLQNFSKQIEIEDLKNHTIFTYYLGLLKDSEAISNEQIDRSFFNTMMSELKNPSDGISDAMYRSLAVAFARRNKIDMAQGLIERIDYEGDLIRAQCDIVLTLANNHSNSDQLNGNLLNVAKGILENMDEDEDGYEIYYTQAIIPLSIELLRCEDSSLIEDAVDCFCSPHNKIFNGAELIDYGTKLIVAIYRSNTLIPDDKSYYLNAIKDKLGRRLRSVGG